METGNEKQISQATIPEKPAPFLIQTLNRIIKNRMVKVMGLSFVLHSAIAASPSFFKEKTDKVEPTKPDAKNIRDEEKNDLISLLDNEDAIAESLYKQNNQKVETKTAERSQKINPAKVEGHKQQLKEQLSKGRKISSADFFEKQEEFAMGIDPAVIKKGKEYFKKQLVELKALKGKLTDEKLLKALAMLIHDVDEDYATKDDTETSVFEYLASQARAEEEDDRPELKGNCKTRYKKIVMALEELFPGKEDKIFAQYLDKHIRAGFRLNNKSYAFEPGKVVEITAENKAGTLIQSSQRTFRRYAELAVVPSKLEPGDYKVGKPMPIAQIDDGLDEPLPEGLQLRSDSDNPREVYQNWNKALDQIQSKINKLDKEESEENAQKGILQGRIIDESSCRTHGLQKWLMKREEEELNKGENDIIIIPNHSNYDLPSVDNIKTLNGWQGKLPLAMYYEGGVLPYFSSDALREIAKTKGHTLWIDAPGNGLPPDFIDNLDPSTLKVEGLEIDLQETGHLPPDQLRKIMSYNTRVHLRNRKPEERALWLANYDLNEEEAAIIAEMNQGGTWLSPGEIIYSDNILQILASTKARLHIRVSSKNQVAKYKRQSPWFFEEKYYAYIYTYN